MNDLGSYLDDGLPTIIAGKDDINSGLLLQFYFVVETSLYFCLTKKRDPFFIVDGLIVYVGFLLQVSSTAISYVSEEFVKDGFGLYFVLTARIFTFLRGFRLLKRFKTIMM